MTEGGARTPWSFLVLALLLAAGVFMWSRVQRTPIPATGNAAHLGDAPSEASRGMRGRNGLATTSGFPTSSTIPDDLVAGKAPLLAGVHFAPAAPVTGSDLTAVPEIEWSEGDETNWNFVWWINGIEVQNAPEDRLQTNFKRGDEIVVEASIETAPGSVQTVRERVVVGNAGPKLETIEHHLNGYQYQALFRVTDPEGDEVLCQCMACPSGMIVDGTTLKWDVREVQGTYPVEVSIRDQHGSGSILSFTLDISDQKGIHVVAQ